MIMGYNTNGLAFHRWQDAVELLAEIGYRAVAITIDHHCLNPFSADLPHEIRALRRLLERHDMRCVIETGARFLLDSRVKHEPTLMTADPADRHRRVNYLERCIDIAAELEADAVSFWSGISRDDIPESQAFDRLVAGCREVADYAERRSVQLAFEPEPGMFIETMDQFGQLMERVDSPRFGLTIDIGHVQCVETTPIPDVLRTWKDRLWNVHIEDMRRGVHEHLLFGEGEIDFPPVMQTLAEIEYSGCVNVELSRHSHVAPQVARDSFEFLAGLLSSKSAPRTE
jgi:L-ribulose-5-phosphate 3-epimerase